MRLAVCALSAILLTGCSGLGLGGSNAGFGQAGGAFGVGCAPGGGFYDAGAFGAGGACGVGGGYGVAGAGYGAGYGGAGDYGASFGAGAGGFGPGAGFGAGAGGFGPGAGFVGGDGGFGAGGLGPSAGFGVGAGAGFGQGTGGFGTVGTGAGFGTVGTGFGGATTLSANAPFGSAAFGSGVVGTQFSNGQFVQGAGVQTVQGAPIFVPQPVPQFFGVPQLRGVGGGLAAAALPFGLGLAIGNEFGLGGTVFEAKEGGPADGGGGEAGAIDRVSYNDAFGDVQSIGGTTEYDISRNTTLLGSFKYGEADGRSFDTGSFTPGTYDSAGNFTPSSGAVTRDLTGEVSDLETFTLEGGVRQYVGFNPALRPYIGATAGATRNNSVDITQIDQNGEIFNQGEFINSGWNPTASAIVGTELAVGRRAAIGLESGVRWTDGLSVNGSDSSSRWSIPLKLRGRVAF